MSDYYTQSGSSDELPLFETTDPNVQEDDVLRLTGQNKAIYARLCKGSATNDELATLSRKYTSRISDIRKAIAPHGMSITCQRLEGGLTRYRLTR